MKRFVAGQSIGAQMITTAGAAFVGVVACYVTKDNGAQAIGTVGSGICTHKGLGTHTYTPSQIETDAAHLIFTFAGSGAITQAVNVYPTFPQTQDVGLHVPEGIRRGVAFNNFQFSMVLSGTNTLAAGKTVTAERVLDNGAFAPCENTVTEIGGGFYRINLTGLDLNGDIITLKFSAAGCDVVSFTFTTS